MKVSVFFLLLIASTTAIAQAKVTLYYSETWELTKKDSAKYIRTAGYDTLNFNFNGPVVDSYPNGKPEMEGSYRSGYKEGKFTFYYDNGQVESTGNFESNSRSGLWKYFYSNGKPKMELEFAPVFGNEPGILYLNDATGKQVLKDGTGQWLETVDLIKGTHRVITGEYKDNEKTGKWEVRTLPGKNTLIEHFKKGVFLNGYARENGQMFEIFEPQEYAHQLPEKFKVTEVFKAKPGVNFTTYPQLKVLLRDDQPVVNYLWDEGEPTYLKLETPATPPGGIQEMYKTLSANMQYPEAAQAMGIQGKVYIEFVVGKNGILKRFKIIKGIGGGCDEEVLRVMEDYATKFTWTAGVYHGRPVKQLILLALEFQLGS